jgi:hypothetical protein
MEQGAHSGCAYIHYQARRPNSLHRSWAMDGGTRFSDSMGVWRRPLRRTDEIRSAKKKPSEKPLIPLPPTGLVSFFCANREVVQTNLQPRLAMGLCGGSAIAQNEKFCRGMQRACTSVPRAVTDGAATNPPVSLGGNFENVGFGGFSKTRTIFFRRRLAGCEGGLNSLQATTGVGCGCFDGFHTTAGG